MIHHRPSWNLESRESFLNWCRRNDVVADVRVVAEDLSPDAVSTIAHVILQATAPGSAIIVSASDYAAIFADTARKSGLSISEDVMLACLSDTEHSSHADPPITALDLRHEEVAAIASDLVFQLLAGAPTPN